MINVENLDLTQAKQSILEKKISSVELTEYFIKKIEDSKLLNCFITKTPEIALEMAKKSDEKISKKQELGLLEGLPIGMKDLFCTSGVKTTAGSKILEDLMFSLEKKSLVLKTGISFFVLTSGIYILVSSRPL